MGAYMSLNTCISVNAADVAGITAEQPVGQRAITASHRSSRKDGKLFEDCIAQMLIQPEAGISEADATENEDTGADAVKDETIGSTILLSSNLFFLKPINLNNTASGTGVRLDTQVSAVTEHTSQSDAHVIPGIITGSLQGQQGFTDNEIIKADETGLIMGEASSPEAVKPLTTAVSEKDGTTTAFQYIEKTVTYNAADLNTELMHIQKQPEAENTADVLTAQLTAEPIGAKEEQLIIPAELKDYDNDKTVKSRDTSKLPEGDEQSSGQTAADNILSYIEDMRGGGDRRRDMNLQDSGKQTLITQDTKSFDEPKKTEDSFLSNVNQFADLPSPLTVNLSSGAIEIDKNTAVERAFSDFSLDLKTLRTGEQELKIVLEPESYGEISITVKKCDEGINAKIKSVDREVCAAISNHVQKLISAIESKGVTVSQVDVIFSQAEGGMDFSQSFSSDSGAQQRGYSYQQTFNAEGTENSVFFDQWQQITRANAESTQDSASGHTVEYRV